MASITGPAFTVADVVLTPTGAQPVASLTVSVYTPVAVMAADGIDGSSAVEEKPAGPDHEYTIGSAPPVIVVERFSVLPIHIGPLLPIALMVAFGFTVIVNVIGVPEQVTLLMVTFGVTVTVATTGVDPLLAAVKEGITVPVPEAPSPIEMVELVQSKVVLATVPLKGIALTEPPSQAFLLDTVVAVGDGLTYWR